MQWHPDARVNEFMVPAPKARRRSRPTAALSSQTKSIGLRFMTKLLSSIKVADEQRLVQLLRTVVSPLARAPPAALFAEWSPAASAAPFEATLAEASASHDNGDARKALHTAAGAWVCTSSALVTWWSAKLTTGTPAASASAEAVGHITQCLKVSRVDVIWEAVPEAKLIPRRCVLEVCTESAPWVVVAAPARFAPKQSFHIDPPVDATQLRLSLRGFADGNSARRHGIASVRVFVVRTTADVVTPSSTMDAITTVLSSIPPSGPSDALVDLSLSGLVSFVQASGSLTQLLSLLQALYDRGSAAADRQSEFSKGVVALLATISEATVALRDKIITQECYTPIAAPAASSSALVPVSGKRLRVVMSESLPLACSHFRLTLQWCLMAINRASLAPKALLSCARGTWWRRLYLAVTQWLCLTVASLAAR